MSTSPRRRLAALSIVFAVLTSGVLLAPSASASGWGGRDNPDVDNTATGVSAQCAPLTTRSIAGTWRGQDGLALNGTIGFDMKDSQGRNVDVATGCLTGGYSTILQMNHYISFSGAKAGTQMRGYVYKPGTGPVLAPMGTVKDTWSITRIPANVTSVWVETYTRNYNGSVCGMPCAGPVSVSKYGFTNRREVKLASSGQTTINLVAPLTAVHQGNTGNLAVRVMQGKYPTQLSSCAANSLKNCLQLYAWSTQAPEGKYLQGWGLVTRNLGNGMFMIQSLYAGQAYVTRVSIYDGAGKRRDYKAYTKVYRNYSMKMSLYTP